MGAAKASPHSPQSMKSPDSGPVTAWQSLVQQPAFLYQLACCFRSFPGLSFHQQKCGKTSSVVSCCTSLHAHGAGLLLLLSPHTQSGCTSASNLFASTCAQQAQVHRQASVPFPFTFTLGFSCFPLFPLAARACLSGGSFSPG